MISRLTHLQLQNFLSWKQLDWNLQERVACLIGENDSGKTNLFKAFELISELARKPLGEVFGPSRRFRSCVTAGLGDRLEVAIAGELATNEAEQSFRYSITLEQPVEGVPVDIFDEMLEVGAMRATRKASLLRLSFSSEPPQELAVPVDRSLLWILTHAGAVDVVTARNLMSHPHVQLASDIASFLVLRLSATNIRRPCDPPAANEVMDPSGSRLASSLERMASDPEYQASYEGVLQQLRQVLPRIKSVGVKPISEAETSSNGSGNKRVLSFASELNGKTFFFDANAASDGTLLILGLIIFGQRPNASGVSLLEEPEAGLHPKLASRFIELLRSYAQNQGQQIMMTTHSTSLLDSLSPEEIWVCTRDENGYSSLHQMSAFRELDRWRDNFGSGEIWANLGEARLIEQ